VEYAVRVRQTTNGAWTASADGLPGCTVKGASREAVLDEMKKAINLYVQGLLEEAIEEPAQEGEGELVVLSV
jgi:predicted RNase H-like HicB family nuclease